jgi:uncharacterized protein
MTNFVACIMKSKKSKPSLSHSTQGFQALAHPLSSLLEALKKESRVLKAWLFGSFAREEASAHSDLDVLIAYQPNVGFTLFDLAELQFQIEKSTGRKVGLVPEDGLKPRVRSTILAERVLIYEKEQSN